MINAIAAKKFGDCCYHTETTVQRSWQSLQQPISTIVEIIWKPVVIRPAKHFLQRSQRSLCNHCAFQQHTDSKIQSPTDKCIFRYRQSNVRRLLPASDYRRARGNQIVEHSSDNETLLGSSRKLGGVAEHLIDGSEKCISRLSFEF